MKWIGQHIYDLVARFRGGVYVESDLSITGNTIITGDLTVNGTTTTINTVNLDVKDNNITLNYSTGDSSSTADGAGITIQDAVNSTTNSTILWDTTNDQFDFSHGATFTGAITIGNTYNTSYKNDGFIFTDNQDYNIKSGNEKILDLHFNEIKFYSGNTERMRLNSTGLGIGTTSPSQKLHIDGGKMFITHDTTEQYNYQYNSSQPIWSFGGGNYFTIKKAGARLFNLTAGGDLGLGVTGPSKRLHVYDTTSGIARLETNQTYSDVELKTNNGTAYVSARDGHVLLNRTGGNNVGIGTDSPSQKLTVEGNIELGTGGYIYGDTTTPYLRLNNAAGTVLGYSTGNISIGPTFVYNTSSGEKFRINHSNGNVGIGTSSPQKKLDIAGGDIRLDNSKGIYFSTLDANIGRVKIIGDESNDFIQMNVDNSNNHVIKLTTTGVGIGTTSPTKKLTVATSATNDGILGITTDGNNFFQAINSNSTAFPVGQISLYYGSTVTSNITSLSNEMRLSGGFTTGGKIVFRTATTERMRLTDTGLGIGTTSPARELEITGTGNVYARITASTSSDSAALELKNVNELWTLKADDTASDSFKITNDGGTKLTLTTGGNLGIGTTSPASIMEINGGSADGVKIIAANAATEFVLNASTSNGTSRLWVGGTGNVGIGTDSPSEKLDVNGNLKIGDGGTGSSLNFNSTDRGTIKVNGSEKARITSGGQLLIATTASATNEYLSIGTTSVYNTTAHIYSNAFGASTLRLTRGSNVWDINNNGIFNIRFGGVDRFSINTNGQATFASQVTIPATPVASTDAASKGYVDAQIGANNDLQEVTDNGATTTNSIVIGSGTNSAPGLSFDSDSNTGVYRASENIVGLSGGGIGLTWDGIHLTTSAGGSFYLEKSGSASSPTYAFQSYTSTGMFRPSGIHAIGFSTNASERMRLTSNGRLGLGVTNPDQALHVESSSDTAIKVKKTGGNYIQLTAGGSGGRITSDHQINFDAGGNPGAMLISAAGKVGIGTNSPDSLLEISSSSTSDFLKLTTAGSGANPIKLIFEKSGSEQGIIEYNRNGDLEIYNTDNDGGVMIDGSASAGADFYVANSGNVGIGTLSPTYPLHVTGNIKTTDKLLVEDSSNSRLELASSISNQARISAHKTNLNQTLPLLIQAEGIKFGTVGGGEKMRLTSGGNLLLGTTTDSGYKLQVDGHIKISSEKFLYLGGNANGFGSNSNSSPIIKSNNGNIFFNSDSSDNINIYLQPNGGEIGDSAKIHFNSRAVVGWFNSAVYLGDNGQNKDIKLQVNSSDIIGLTSNTERFRIKSGGNFLIGTTTDSGAKLSVVANTTYQPLLVLRNSGTDASHDIYMGYNRDNSTGSDGWSTGIDSTDNAFHISEDADSINNNVRLKITSGGNLLIGTTTDDNKGKIQVSDTGTSGVTGHLSFYNDNNAYTYLALKSGSNTTLFGTHEYGNGYVTATNALSLGSNHSSNSSRLWLGNNSRMMVAHSDGTEYLRVSNNGNLLINTTSDDGSSKLQVDGDVKFLGATSGRYMWWDESLDSLRLPANTKLNMNNFTLHHDGSNANVTNSVGNINIVNNSDDGNISFSSDDGVGNTTEYFRLDGSVTRTKFAKPTQHADDIYAYFGNSDDLRIFHSSGGNIANHTNDLRIQNWADGKDIRFECDNGTGGLTDYIKIDGSQTTVNVYKTLLIGTTTNTGAYKIDVAGKQRVQDTLELDDVLMLNQISTPADPAAGKSVIYMDSADGGIKCKINVGGTVVTRTLASFE